MAKTAASNLNPKACSYTVLDRLDVEVETDGGNGPSRDNLTELEFVQE
jgi:hypothetical protein